MPPITDAMINPFGPMAKLEQRVTYLETQVETTRRAVYGDPPNRTPGIADEIHSVKIQLDRMARHALYWRATQGAFFVVLFGMLLGVLLR